MIQPTTTSTATFPTRSDRVFGRGLGATTPPVITVGPLRSGTTMLRLMLNAHRDLNFFCEMEYATLGAAGDSFPDVATYRRLLETDRMYHIRAFAIDEALSHRELVRSFMDAGRGVAPEKPFVGVTVHHRIDLLPQIWPEAKYIHVLRDPRDVARSTIGMGWSGNVYHGARFWLEPEQRWDRLCEQIPAEQRFEVRFEDLVAAPRPHWEELCDFIGVDYDPGMENYHQGTTYEPPDASLTYQWRRKLSEAQIRQVEAVVGDLLVQRGYERSGLPPLSPGPVGRRLLELDHRLRRIKLQWDRYGTGLWLSRVVSKRTGPKAWRDAVQRRINDRDTQLLR